MKTRRNRGIPYLEEVLLIVERLILLIPEFVQRIVIAVKIEQLRIRVTCKIRNERNTCDINIPYVLAWLYSS